MPYHGKSLSVPKGLAIGALIQMLLTIAGVVILAYMVVSETVRFENIGYWIMLILMSVSFAGAWGAKTAIKRRKLLICLLSGLIYTLMLLTLTLLFFGAEFHGAAVSSGLIFAGSMVAGLLGTQKRKQNKSVWKR